MDFFIYCSNEKNISPSLNNFLLISKQSAFPCFNYNLFEKRTAFSMLLFKLGGIHVITKKMKLIHQLSIRAIPIIQAFNG